MNNVVPFHRSTINNDALMTRIGEGRNSRKVELAINQLGNYNTYRLTRPYMIVPLEESHNQGAPEPRYIKPRIKRDKPIIVVHAAFPEALHEQAGLSPTKALDTAACYILAYGVVLDGLSRAAALHRPIVVRSKFQPELWTNEYGIETERNPAVAYRMAATIALESIGRQKPLEITGEPPFPPHLASLADPYDRREFGQLHSVLK